MNYKNLIIIFFFIFLTSCEQYSSNKKIINQEIPSKYKNSGFALIYKDILKSFPDAELFDVKPRKED